jgi:hypothetical protein
VDPRKEEEEEDVVTIFKGRMLTGQAYLQKVALQTSSSLLRWT